MLPNIGISTRYRGPRPRPRYTVGKQIVDGLDMEGFLDFRIGRDEKMQQHERRDEDSREKRHWNCQSISRPRQWPMQREWTLTKAPDAGHRGGWKRFGGGILWAGGEGDLISPSGISLHHLFFYNHHRHHVPVRFRHSLLRCVVLSRAETVSPLTSRSHHPPHQRHRSPLRRPLPCPQYVHHPPALSTSKQALKETKKARNCIN